MTLSVTKGLITSQDQHNFDGVKDSVTRRDSTGGTVSGLPIGAVVDVLAAYGNGESYTQATIQRAINAIGTGRNRTLLFRPGTWEITSNLTIASNFSVAMPAGAVFDVASGVTLTISGTLINDHATYSSGAGTVSAPANSFVGNVDVPDHDESSVGLKLAGVLVTASAAELNILDGATITTDELNILDGVTATAAEINALDGLTATATELNENDRSAQADSNHALTLREYTYNTSATAIGASPNVSVEITALMASDTYESFGPTGSGATNIWTAMDLMPSDAKVIKLKAGLIVTSNAAGATILGISLRPGDATWTSGGGGVSHNLRFDADAASETFGHTFDPEVALDTGDQTFDLSYFDTNQDGTETAIIYYMGCKA